MSIETVVMTLFSSISFIWIDYVYMYMYIINCVREIGFVTPAVLQQGGQNLIWSDDFIYLNYKPLSKSKIMIDFNLIIWRRYNVSTNHSFIYPFWTFYTSAVLYIAKIDKVWVYVLKLAKPWRLIKVHFLS